MDRNTMNTLTGVVALVVEGSVTELVVKGSAMELVTEDSVMELRAQDSVLELMVKDSGMDLDEAHVRDLRFEDSGMDLDEDSDIPTTEDSDIDLTTEDSDIDLTTEDSDIDLTTEDSDIDHTTEDSDINPTTGNFDIDLTTEDSNINPTTKNSDIGITRRFIVKIPAGFFIIDSDGEIIDLISDPRMMLDEVFRYFPSYEPKFRGEPHLNSLHRFVCEDTCFLRNWLFVQDMLFRRFWYQFCRTNDAIRLPSLDTDAVGALGEIISFFAFATIPFDTQRLPNNNWIGNYGRLLRPDLDTFLQVWQFYDDPLFGELSAALGTRHLPLVRSVSDNAQQVVANVFLDCELEPAGDPERIEATVCFNAGNQIHVREVTRSWINFKNNVDKRLEQLAPWRGCYGTGMEEGTGMEKGKMLTVLPKEYFPPDTNLGNNIIEPPRIRRSYWADEPVPQLVNHDWWDTAAHYNFFLANAEERSRPVSREEPEPPRQPSLGDGLL